MGLEEFGTQEKDKDLNAKTVRGEPALQIEERSPKEESEKLKKTQWSIVGNGTFLSSSSTVKQLPPGMYKVVKSEIGILFIKQTLNTDDLIDFPDSVFDDVIKEIDDFWTLGKAFTDYGFLHRRGFLLYGPAGGGKSCLVSRICRNIISQGGLVFLCNDAVSLFSHSLSHFREVEPDRQIICVFEDIDAIVERTGEAEILSLLDGENQVDKLINLATTNYPERLDRRIVSRPRRFDRIIKVGMPDAPIRRVFFKKKLKLPDEDVEKWVSASDGLSFAALSEMVIGIKCLGNDFDSVVKRLKEMVSKKVSSSEFDSGGIGF